MKSINPQKIVIALTVFALLLSSIIAVTYGNLSDRQSSATLANVEMPTPPSFQIQVNSPVDNFTYGNYNGPENITSDQAAHRTTYNLILPLNITANPETSSITYSLDGSNNSTFNENTTASLTLSYGVHNLTAYATNIEGIVCESEIAFTVGYGYPLSTNITIEEAQEATRYFEGRGLNVQAEPIDESKWQNVIYFLYAGSVDVVSKESFADIVIAHGLNTICFYQDSNQVSFYVRIYGNSWLPIFYAYSATLV